MRYLLVLNKLPQMQQLNSTSIYYHTVSGDLNEDPESGSLQRIQLVVSLDFQLRLESSALNSLQRAGLRLLPHGPLHRASDNMAAGFSQRRRKKWEPRQQPQRLSLWFPQGHTMTQQYYTGHTDQVRHVWERIGQDVDARRHGAWGVLEDGSHIPSYGRAMHEV